MKNLCYGCMSEKETGEEICKKCGFSAKDYNQDGEYLNAGSVLHGQYIVGKILGQGGFGITYLGFDKVLEMKVAIKEYYPSGLASRSRTENQLGAVSVFQGEKSRTYGEGLKRFLDEAKKLAKFSKLEGIVHVLNFFEENNTAYLVMDYIEGISLRNYTNQNGGKISVDKMLVLMRPIIQSLEEVHAAGVIHRDISPDNIMIDGQGRAKLIDFGAARKYIENENRSMSVLIKHGYAPEEQYRTKGEQGPWTDVYALCATFYRTVTGETPPEAVERIVDDTIRPIIDFGIECAVYVNDAVMKGLAVLKRDRTSSMKELFCGLYGQTMTNSAISTEFQEVRANTDILEEKERTVCLTSNQTHQAQEITRQTEQKKKKKRGPLIAVGGLIVLLLSGGVFYLQNKPDKESNKQETQGEKAGDNKENSAKQTNGEEKNTGKSENAEQGKDAGKTENAEQGKNTGTTEDSKEVNTKQNNTNQNNVDGTKAADTMQIDLQKFYEEDKYADALLEDAYVKKKLKEVLGTKYTYFIECFEVIEKVDYDYHRKAYYFSGAVPGLYTVMEGACTIYQSGEIECAYLEDGNIYYIASEMSMYKNLGSNIENWVFREKEGSIVFAKSISTNLTGQYIAMDGSNSVIKINKDSNGNYYVDGTANYGAYSGEMYGKLNYDTAEEKYTYSAWGDEVNATLFFINDYISVWDDGTLGGMNVTFSGIYKKYSENYSIVVPSQDTDKDSETNWDYAKEDKEYILPYSSTMYLSISDLYGLSADQARYARNEIYARHGRKFKDKDLQKYFDNCSWYYGFIEPEDFDESWLNEYEKENVKVIKEYENSL